MTLRAQKPTVSGDTDFNPHDDEMDWQGTLLDPSLRRRTAPVAKPAYLAGEGKSRAWLVAACLGVIALGFAGYYFAAGSSTPTGELPVVQADAAPFKLKPATPGGQQVPFQDALVFNRLDANGQPVQAEKLLPPAEEPMALALAPEQRVAPTAPPVAATTLATPETAGVAPVVPAAKIVVPPATEPAIKPGATQAGEEPAPVVAEVAAPVVAAQPTSEVAVAPVVAPVKTEAKPAVKAEPAPAPPTGQAAAGQVGVGQVRIQLASIPSQANAQKALADFSSKYASALGGTKLSVVKADLGSKGVFYRVQSAPVSRTQADRICGSVKATGGACIIVR